MSLMNQNQRITMSGGVYLRKRSVASDEDVQYLGTRIVQPDMNHQNEVRKRQRTVPGPWGDSFSLPSLEPFPRSAHPARVIAEERCSVLPPRFEVVSSDPAGRCLDTSTMLGSSRCDVDGAFNTNSVPCGLTKQHVKKNPPLGTSKHVKRVKKLVYVCTFKDLFMPNEEMIETDERFLNHEKLGIGADTVEPMRCDEGTKSEVNAGTDTMSMNHDKVGVGAEPMKCDEGTKSGVNADTVEPMRCDVGTKSEVNADTDTVSMNHEKLGVGAEPMKCDEGTKSEVNADTDTVSLNHKKLGVGGEPMKCDEGTKCDTISLEKRNKRGVSLIEQFTEEEIKLHMMSLTKPSSQSVIRDPEEEEEEEEEDEDEESCQLCGNGRLSLPPPPIYCLSCCRRIKDEAVYYTPTEEISNGQLHFCSPCRNIVCRSKFKLSSGITITKSKMIKRSNVNNQVMEQWVQCISCEKWQHQICGLYNFNKDKDNTADYVCPKCLLEERQSNNNMPVDDNTFLGAKDLPETILSYSLEQRLVRRLKEERRETAKATGKKINDVPEPEGLTLRVVYSADKISTVNKPLADLLHKKNHPTEFPYRSKVILLFQKVEGVDVCIFALFVQECGSECSQPNQRSTYIVYLDSVKYFRPERLTFAGEALRTFVYHEILIGYLEYCKHRGFTTSYIWACPPEVGEDYIMYSHPKTQQTPNSKKLRQWYTSMLEKAVEQRVVTNTTNLYDRFFVSREEPTCNMTAARLPYFEGSLWSNNAEVILQDMESEGNNEVHNMFRSLTKRKLKSMSYKSTACGDVDFDECKNILLMQKLEKIVFKNKEDLIVLDLNYSCTRCSKAILSGLRWFCGKCKNLQLCESCYDSKQELPGEHIYATNNKEKHHLSKDRVNVTTEDNDIIQENDMFDSRQAFLAISQKNNYIFNTLRHAKNSSMMILHHLHTLNKHHHHHSQQNSSSLITCTACKKDVSTTIYFPCLLCPDYRACTGCYTKNITMRQLHVFPTLPIANGAAPRSVMVLEILNALQHARLCQPTASKSCSYPKCKEVKALFSHSVRCKTKEMGVSCIICHRLSQTVRIHVHHCRDLYCPIPDCRERKEHLTRKDGVKH